MSDGKYIVAFDDARRFQCGSYAKLLSDGLDNDAEKVTNRLAEKLWQ